MHDFDLLHGLKSRPLDLEEICLYVLLGSIQINCAAFLLP